MIITGKFRKVQMILMMVCALVAVVIILDYSLPGKILVEEVLAVKKTYENYYNAGGNYHISFKIHTAHHTYYVSKTFASLVQKGLKLETKTSPFFNEVNSSEILTTGNTEVHLLRMLSGFILPVFVLLVLTLGYKYGSRVSTLVFIIEVITVVDLIYLLN
jgi:hypothetical protein